MRSFARLWSSMAQGCQAGFCRSDGALQCILLLTVNCVTCRLVTQALNE